MSSELGRVQRKRSVTKRPRVNRMAPTRRRGKAPTKSDTDIESDPDCRLLLSNVGTDVEETAIDEIFGELGKVNKVVIHCNPNDERIGTAEVWLSTTKEANKAKAKLNASDIFGDGRIIRIEKTKLLTKLSSFWKSVYKYVSLMNVKPEPEDTDPRPTNLTLNSD